MVHVFRKLDWQNRRHSSAFPIPGGSRQALRRSKWQSIGPSSRPTTRQRHCPHTALRAGHHTLPTLMFSYQVPKHLQRFVAPHLSTHRSRSRIVSSAHGPTPREICSSAVIGGLAALERSAKASTATPEHHDDDEQDPISSPPPAVPSPEPQPSSAHTRPPSCDALKPNLTAVLRRAGSPSAARSSPACPRRRALVPGDEY
jgi:hypothetical protein